MGGYFLNCFYIVTLNGVYYHSNSDRYLQGDIAKSNSMKLSDHIRATLLFYHRLACIHYEGLPPFNLGPFSASKF